MRLILSGIDLQFDSPADAAGLIVSLINLSRAPVATVVTPVPTTEGRLRRQPRASVRALPPRRTARPRKPSRQKRTMAAPAPAAVNDGELRPREARRQAVLELMKAGPVTFGELLRKLPAAHLSGDTEEQRVISLRNLLQNMKVEGAIERAGQNWVRK